VNWSGDTVRQHKTTHHTPKWDARPARTVTLDPVQLAAAGVHEPVSITLPPGFDAMTRMQRQAWAIRQVHAEVDDLLAELLP
jgi:hypothetical protein